MLLSESSRSEGALCRQIDVSANKMLGLGLTGTTARTMGLGGIKPAMKLKMAA